ncbi:MAG TPA: amidohydrolase family protein [Alloacidobacterium sp.]|nr:amidohydrolase family protein [Alloacidobacterium sp.]
MKRRDFLKGAVAAACTAQLCADTSSSIPIIDTHIHLYDPSRPEGVPWPEKTDTVLYKPALPDRYKNITQGLNIRGAIAIECSPWESDNDWLLKTAEKDPIMVGIIGDLVPGSPTFRKNLDRLSANPLFRGIRYGNLWNRNLATDMDKPGFIEDLKALSQAKLVLDSANPDPELVAALVRVKDKVPELTIVIDHLPNAPGPIEQYTVNLQKLRDNPGVLVKLSEIPTRIENKVPLNLSFYRHKLDTLWGIFGENRVLFGSDWPNSDHLANYAQTFSLIHQYLETKSREAQEKFFWRNSIAAYGWHPRLANQPR